MRTDLYDDRVNFMGLASPKELHYLNFNESPASIPDGFFPHFTVMVTLTDKVIIQKRVVYDAFMMFGDVGGLRDFVGLFLSAIFTFFSERILKASLVQKMFHVSTSNQHDSFALPPAQA